MAGTLVLDTIRDGTGTTASITNLLNGGAKAWINIYAGSTPSIRASYNVSSITRTGTGQFSFSFTTAMPNVNYVVVAMPASDLTNARFSYIDGTNSAMTTTSFVVQIVAAPSSAQDATYLGVVVFGS